VSVRVHSPEKCGVVMGALGPIHWLIIAAIVFLLFGNRLPSVMRSLGQGVVEFKKGLQGIDDDVKNSGSSNSSRIEEQPSKPHAKEEAEHGHPESAPR
jgi:sec-independent protein translocase protein TatA